jgi:Zn-finger nucleic acid-binding protein
MTGTSQALRPPVSCPACSAPSAIVNLGPVKLDICTGCSGLWFDRDELSALGALLSNEQPSNEQLADGLRELAGALYAGSERTGKVYLSCPVCHEAMQRQNYAAGSGVQVCRCAAHGTWVERVAATRLVRLMRGERDAELRELEQKQRAESAPSAPVVDVDALDARARLKLVLELLHFT